MSAFCVVGPKLAMPSVFGLVGWLLLAGCSRERSVEDSKPATEAAAQAESNSLPTLPPIVFERHEPSLVEHILQSAKSRAQVSFATNADGVECTFTSPDREDRFRVQALVKAMFGSCRGTVDPPTVTFKLKPPAVYRPGITSVRVRPAAGDDVNSRLQQRLQYEKGRDAKEIHDLEAEIIADEAELLTIANRAVAFNQAEILRAKKSRLSDLKAFYLDKYKENP
jgi:hypothetical protein